MVFELDGVSIEVAGRQVLRDVRFSVGKAERIVVLGVNGCGKTTLLKLLDGLMDPTRGTIRYEETALSQKALADDAFRRRFRSEVGFLFQNVDAMLFNPTVEDEIAFGPRQLGLRDVDERVQRWAAELGLCDLLQRPPFELSGGEKKRVAMAAILVLEPKVLLLDEPTASLDPASTARLVDRLSSMTDTTIITSTHNLTAAEELGNRALLLCPNREGSAFDGPCAELLANEELLIESGLAHRHVHVHGKDRHVHYHVHDLD